MIWGDFKVKIAFLIMAHGNIEQLNCFLRQLLAYPESYIYIHLDLKAGDAEKAVIHNERINILPERYNLNWGDYSLIEATNYLLRYSSSKQHHDYYSLHSGVDMAIKPVKDLAAFLEKDRKFFYSTANALPYGEWNYGGGLGRIALKWPEIFRQKVERYSAIRFVRGFYGRLYNLRFIQQLFPVSNKYRFYGGSEWFTASSDCIAETLRFLDEHTDYDLLFRNAISADEIYFNTVFEAVRNGREAVYKNLCHMSWCPGKTDGVGGPIIYTKEYITLLDNSEEFFARKFDLNYDRGPVEYFAKNT